MGPGRGGGGGWGGGGYAQIDESYYKIRKTFVIDVLLEILCA